MYWFWISLFSKKVHVQRDNKALVDCDCSMSVYDRHLLELLT